MTTQYPAVVMPRLAKAIVRGAWIVGGTVIAANIAVGLYVGTSAAMNGELTSSTDDDRWDIRSWQGLPIGLAFLGLYVWQWRSFGRRSFRCEPLVTAQPTEGGVYLTGNHGRGTGASLLVRDGTALRILRFRTESQRRTPGPTYGLHFMSDDGAALIELDVWPVAIDIRPLLADMAQRGVVVDVDPVLMRRVHRGFSPRSPEHPLYPDLF